MTISPLLNERRFRILFPLAAFVIFFTVLVANIDSLEQHNDEKIFTWKAAYFSKKILELNFQKGDSFSEDPGFHPYSFWAMEQPFGSHMIYATAMQVFSLDPPDSPFSYTLGPEFQGPDTDVPKETLHFLRTIVNAFSALGLSLITYKFKLRGFIASAMLLAIPHVRDDLSRVWAEGPLHFGFGLCAVAYRRKWFALACGAVAAIKLTGFILWIPLLLPDKMQARYLKEKFKELALASIVFTVLNPISWVNGGPAYLVVFIFFRINEWLGQNASIPTLGNVFFPSRYLWPIELLVFLLIVNAIFSRLDWTDGMFLPEIP